MITRFLHLETLFFSVALLLAGACGQTPTKFNETAVEEALPQSGDSEAARQGTTNAVIQSTAKGDGSDTTGSDTTGGDTTGADTTGADTTGGDTTAGDMTGGDGGTDDNTTAGDTTSGDTTAGDTTGGSDDTGGMSDEDPDAMDNEDHTGLPDSDGGTTDQPDVIRAEIEATCSNKGTTGKYHIAGNGIDGSESLTANPGDLFYIKLTGKNIHWTLNLNVAADAGLTTFDANRQVFVCVAFHGSSNTATVNTGIDAKIEVKRLGKPNSHTFNYSEHDGAKVELAP